MQSKTGAGPAAGLAAVSKIHCCAVKNKRIIILNHGRPYETMV